MENKYSKKYLIETGIGLQDVDNLKNSSYFLKEANRYIKGEISLEELDKIVTSYYKNKPNEEERTKEADQTAERIAKLISEDSFTFSVGQLISIHKTLFADIFPHAGKLRTYNFIKKEWVLDGASVVYGDYREIETILEYDFSIEKRFSYLGLSMNEVIEHLSIFISNLWQIHTFEEGNTRTTAVFIIKYLRSLGFDVTNDIFAKNAWYFRNALVRANFNFIRKGITEDRSYLIKFLKNLILGENNHLNNKELHVAYYATNAEDGREIRIINLMKENPSISTQEIADQLGVSLRTAKSLIATLQQNGKIKRNNGKRFGTWEVK